MSDPVFYVESSRDDKLTGYVPARFLLRNGAYVMNPTPGGSQQSFIYSDRFGNDQTKGSIANPSNYLIVPANYTEQQARDFASRIAGTLNPVYPDETGTTVPRAVAQMIAAFLQGGSQDLQRHPQWGVPKGSVVPAFVGGASNHLGYVTGLAGLPVDWSEIGGGAANWINGHVVQPMNRILSRKATSIDAEGPYGLSRQNHANISQGFSEGLAASKAPTPFNYYGYGTQPQRSAGQIGDGNGIAGWTSSVTGEDPQEPAPPAWPPSVDRPIRYLSRRTQ